MSFGAEISGEEAWAHISEQVWEAQIYNVQVKPYAK